jgi:hypothetical protein
MLSCCGGQQQQQEQALDRMASMTLQSCLQNIMQMLHAVHVVVGMAQ